MLEDDTSADFKKIMGESKESTENLEWAELNINLELGRWGWRAAAWWFDKIEAESKKGDDISKELKELTGDCSEDENEAKEETASAEVAKTSTANKYLQESEAESFDFLIS